ncbi:hypothetical protein ACJMK2_018984 [Sinanodonta woodiana]|uniref:TIR domain-containing protein n=1 Tax=Sinanodonta woodiana TaxID=1069815 RepID=A0ABD3UFA9_SINWO
MMAVCWLSVLILTAMFANYQTTTSDSSCKKFHAKKCKCKEDMKQRPMFQCSHLGLTEVPELPKTTFFLNLCHNKLEILRNGSFSNFSQLLTLLVAYNYIQVIELDAFRGLENLTQLVLDFNSLPLSAKIFQKGVFLPLTRISYLSMRNSNKAMKHNFKHDLIQFRSLNTSLHTLDASNITSVKWTRHIVGLNNLKILDLSYNLCTNIDKHFFANFNTLETLLIGHNLLGSLIMKDVKGKLLRNLHFVKKLDISHNSISFIPSKFFQGLSSLEIVDVSKNFLQTANFEIDHMKKLSQLDFRENLLTSIPANMLRHLHDIDSNNISIYLENNPLKCVCDDLDFLNWIVNEKNRITFANVEKTNCKFNGISRSIRDIKLVINALDKHCANYTIIISIASLSFAIFIIITITGLIYRYRWKLRYFYYMTKSRYRGYTSLNEHDSENYQYHAFLSYAESNLRLVKFTLLAKLEAEGLHVCIHHRDFMPGQPISANIAHAIHCSRRTVVLLDDDYLSSYWCMYELNMVRMESIYSRKGENILVLVLNEGIDKCKLPLELMDIIHSNTYIELPQDPQVIDASGICGRIKDAILG